MKMIIVDDDQFRHDWFAKKYYSDVRIHTYSVAQACQELSRHKGTLDAAFLDYDLMDFGPTGMYGDKQEYTGQHVAKFIASLPWCDRPQDVIIHSHNPVGAGKMYDILVDKVDQLHIISFSRLMEIMR